MSGTPEVRVAADYGCFATWRRTADGSMANVSPTELQLPESLLRALGRWAEVYDATLDLDDPMSSGFATELEHEVFSLWGRAIAELLAHALGQEVEYFDDCAGTYSIVR